MNYLITGATGFLGKRLVNHLLMRGDSVNYLARKRSTELDSRAAYHCWHTAEEKPPLRTVPRLDAIVHLMGEPVAQRWTEAAKKRIYSSRVEGTRQLVSAIAELPYKPLVLVSASAVGYYGDRGDELLTESSHPGSGFLAEVCRDWEREALRAREFGPRVVTVRIAAVLGREGGALAQMLTPFRLGLGAKFGSGRQWMSWIHAEDLMRLFVFAAENAAVSGALNGSSPNPVTNAQFTRSLAKALSRPALFAIPGFTLKLALGELASFLFDSQRVLPQAAEEAGFSFKHPQLAEAFGDMLS
jgi:uncharacterized protein (TIGR01777 family)